MAYTRFLESDVYVYAGNGYWNCCGCRLPVNGVVPEDSDRPERRFRTRLTLLKHLMEHLRVGHVVSTKCTDRILQELAEQIPQKKRKK